MIYSCTPSRPHELMGSQPRRPYYPELPVGMVYIPAGGFTLGLQDQDIFMTQDAKHKVVSIASFYMDQTEITNNEYRQFVDWVRDSIALEKLVDRALAEDVEDYINFEQDVLLLPTTPARFIISLSKEKTEFTPEILIFLSNNVSNS